MKYSTIPTAQLVVILIKAAGIKDIIISPGSRNAPLTLSFTDDPYFSCFSIVDERCAAFFGLGMAQQQQRPVALLCTSGSALLNYYPAIAEAFYSDVPLVVITADRPPYKIDVGDGQTIRQDRVFDRHIAYSAHLKIDVSHARERVSRYWPEHLKNTQEYILSYNKEEIEKSLEAVCTKQQPVHINVPFEEPLYETIIANNGQTELPSFMRETKEIISRDVCSQWATAKKKMILVGVSSPHAIETELIRILADDPSVIVLTETTSNLHHDAFFPSIDSIIFPIEKSKNRDERFEALRPELLLTFGGLVVSKKVKAFLRQYRPKVHWHVHPTKAFDTFFALDRHFKMEIGAFLKRVVDNGYVESRYFDTWNQVKRAYEKKRDVYVKNVPFSDFKVFGLVQAAIPNGYCVHYSNSSAIRYSQLFPISGDISVFCNRGTSGIDGSTSTAIGASIYQKTPTLLITGDLSFFYDSNALWNNYVRNDFRIILVNNSGGGIFRILPGFDNSDNFSTFFETKHQMSARHICAQFGMDHLEAKNCGQLSKELKTFFEQGSRAKLLEISTPRDVNDKILLDYFDFISSEYK